MGVLDLEVQHERRVGMLREAEAKRVAEHRRPGRVTRVISKLFGFLVNIGQATFPDVQGDRG